MNRETEKENKSIGEQISENIGEIRAETDVVKSQKSPTNDINLKHLFARKAQSNHAKAEERSNATETLIKEYIELLGSENNNHFWNKLTKEEFCDLICGLFSLGVSPRVPIDVVDKFVNTSKLFESEESSIKEKIEGKDFCIVNAEANRNGSLHEFNREDELKVHSGNTKSDDLLCAWLGYVFLDYVWDVKLNQWFANRQNKGKRGWFHAFLFYISDSANRLRLYKWVFGKDADKSFNLWDPKNGKLYKSENYLTTMESLRSAKEDGRTDVDVSGAIELMNEIEIEYKDANDQKGDYSVSKADFQRYLKDAKFRAEYLDTRNGSDVKNLIKFIENFICGEKVSVTLSSFTRTGQKPEDEARTIHQYNFGTPYQPSSRVKGILFPKRFPLKLHLLIGQNFSKAMDKIRENSSLKFLDAHGNENHKELHEGLFSVVMMLSFYLSTDRNVPSYINGLVNKSNTNDMVRHTIDFINAKGHFEGMGSEIDSHCKNIEKIYPLLMLGLPEIIDKLENLREKLEKKLKTDYPKEEFKHSTSSYLLANWLYKEDVGLTLFLAFCIQDISSKKIESKSAIEKAIDSFTQRFTESMREKWLNSLDSTDENNYNDDGKSHIQKYIEDTDYTNEDLKKKLKEMSLPKAIAKHGNGEKGGLDFNLGKLIGLVLYLYRTQLRDIVKKANVRGGEFKKKFQDNTSQFRCGSQTTKLPFAFLDRNDSLIIGYYDVNAESWYKLKNGIMEKLSVEVGHAMAQDYCTANSMYNITFWELHDTNTTKKEHYRNVVLYLKTVKILLQDEIKRLEHGKTIGELLADDLYRDYSDALGNLEKYSSLIFEDNFDGKFKWDDLGDSIDVNPKWIIDPKLNLNTDTFVLDCINGKDFS
tara:strand:- start:5081 stop:7699 length:2619 start_codon:yes stop_codon:yes gene_type:complete